MANPIPFPVPRATTVELEDLNASQILAALQSACERWGEYAGDKRPDDTDERQASRLSVNSLLWDVNPYLEALQDALQAGDVA